MLRKSFNVLKNEGFNILLQKIFRNISNGMKYLIYYDKNNNEKVLLLKNKFKSKRVFLIGNGPSLNKTPLYLLKNEYTIAFNRFNLMFERINWYPNFYAAIDSVVAKDMADEINEITQNVEYAFFPAIHSDGTVFKNFINERNNILWLKPSSDTFSENLPGVVFGGTVSYAAIQILVYLGFKEIVLIGVDMNYQIHTTIETEDGNTIKARYDDDPNHFDQRYFGANRSYHQPDPPSLKVMFNSFDKAFNYSIEKGIKIINAGYDSAVNSFPKVEFTSLFNFSAAEKLNLFLSSLGCNGKFNSLEDAFPDIVRIHDLSEWKDDYNYLLVDETLAYDLIKNKILTHIPFGPYDNKYIFKKRNLA